MRKLRAVVWSSARRPIKFLPIQLRNISVFSTTSSPATGRRILQVIARQQCLRNGLASKGLFMLETRRRIWPCGKVRALRLSRPDHEVVPLTNLRRAAATIAASGEMAGLAYGMGRSYGDSCLNPGGTLWAASGMSRLLAFDPDTGVLRCEAGILFRDIQDVMIPQGWALPVTPGTQTVTVGGAIANDVHGKNHHVSGSFGDHVERFHLARTDGQEMDCSPTENADWFAATVGGLGLTGFITQAEIQLKPVPGPWLTSETIPYDSLDAIKSYDVPYFVHISSSVVESSADDFYTNSKKEQEEMVLASGISCPILRPTLMFGWFDRKHLGWLSRFMKKALFFRCPAADATCANPYMLAIFAALSSAASRTGSKMVFTTSPVMSRSTTSTLLKRSSEQRARARPS
jgi:hypothetical protein